MGVVELLLHYNVDVNARSKRRQTALHMCASMRSGMNGLNGINPPNGSSMNQLASMVNSQGRPPPESEDIARRLFLRGVKVCPRDIHGATPLHLACGVGNAPLVSLILEKMLKKMPDSDYLVLIFSFYFIF